MQDKQYDVSPELLKLFEEKQKQRTTAKEYYRKLLNNPYRPITDGIPIDPGLQRYHAMSMYHVDLYKPAPGATWKYLLCLSPMLLIYFHLRYSKNKKEKAIRSGLVRYEDRAFTNLF